MVIGLEAAGVLHVENAPAVPTGNARPRTPRARDLHVALPLTAKSAPHGLRSGQSVFHTKFGEGVILTLEGQGDDARAQVNFAP